MRKIFSLVSTGFAVALLSSPPAIASCPSWHPLTNNTTASASDVMDNFGVVLGCPNFTGNVGIGIGSPSYPLTVNGAVYNNTTAYFSMGNYTGSGPTLIVGDGQYGLSALGSALYLCMKELGSE